MTDEVIGGTASRKHWAEGIAHELGWWRAYIAGAGLGWPNEYRARVDPTTPLQPFVAGHLPSISPDRPPRILDCAAGPMTTLRKVYRGQPVDLVAVDALADHYDALLADLKIQPPVRSQRCEIEHLDRLFAPADFDLVYMRFALDHCYDPLLALRQMVRVTRPGGAVVVEHYRDAAQTDHQGLRQWDLVPSDDDLVVRNTTAAFSVAEEFPDLEHSVTYSATWLTLVLRL